MYGKSGYTDLSTNGNTVYCKDCKKYLATRREFDEIYWRIHSRSPSNTSKVSARNNTEKKI